MATAYHRGEHVEVGKRRWFVTWETPKAGHIDNPECEDHFIESCYDWHGRAFPRKSLALAHAKKIVDSGVTMWGCASVREEVFEAYEQETAFGSWETVGDAVEVAS